MKKKRIHFKKQQYNTTKYLIAFHLEIREKKSNVFSQFFFDFWFKSREPLIWPHLLMTICQCRANTGKTELLLLK